MDTDTPGADAHPSPAPRAVFNGLLAGIVRHLLDHTPHADFFRGPVSRVVVTDYNDFVPASQEMYLGRMLERAEHATYGCFAEFHDDLRLIRANAVAYNGRGGGRHAYEPVIHWATELEAAAIQQVALQAELLLALEGAIAQAGGGAGAACTAPAPLEAAPLASSPAAVAAAESAAAPAPLALPPCEDGLGAQHQQEQEHEEPRQQPWARVQLAAGSGTHAGSSTCGANASVHKQPSSMSSDSGGGGGGGGRCGDSRRELRGGVSGSCGGGTGGGGGGGRDEHVGVVCSGLDVLLAACDMAAGEDAVAAPADGDGRGSSGGGGGSSSGGGGGGSSSGGSLLKVQPDALPPLAMLPPSDPAPERLSHPGSDVPGPATAAALAPVAAAVAADGLAGPLAPQRELRTQSQLTVQPEEPAGSSEDGMMAACGSGSGGGAATQEDSGGGGGGGGGPTGRPAAAGAGGGRRCASSYLTSNAFKNRRHKSKVYVKPSKVVYLPTAFVEEEFDVSALPLDCELAVEADGGDTGERFTVTLKAVPRSGLSTMYCITNVMAFQQRYLHWQIWNWTRIDATHIKIHLQSPSGGQGQPQRPELDRAGSVPESDRDAGTVRGGDDVSACAGAWGPGVGAGLNLGLHLGLGPVPGLPAGPLPGGSLKRKSDSQGRSAAYGPAPPGPGPSLNLGAGLPGRGPLLPLNDSSGVYDDPRLSASGFVRRASPAPESPPVSPQRRHSSGYSNPQHPPPLAQLSQLPLRLPPGWPAGLPPHGRVHRAHPLPHPHAHPHPQSHPRGALPLGLAHPHPHALPPLYPSQPFGVSLPFTRPHPDGAAAAVAVAKRGSDSNGLPDAAGYGIAQPQSPRQQQHQYHHHHQRSAPASAAWLQQPQQQPPGQPLSPVQSSEPQPLEAPLKLERDLGGGPSGLALGGAALAQVATAAGLDLGQGGAGLVGAAPEQHQQLEAAALRGEGLASALLQERLLQLMMQAQQRQQHHHLAVPVRRAGQPGQPGGFCPGALADAALADDAPFERDVRDAREGGREGRAGAHTRSSYSGGHALVLSGPGDDDQGGGRTRAWPALKLEGGEALPAALPFRPQQRQPLVNEAPPPFDGDRRMAGEAAGSDGGGGAGAGGGSSRHSNSSIPSVARREGRIVGGGGGAGGSINGDEALATAAAGGRPLSGALRSAAAAAPPDPDVGVFASPNKRPRVSAAAAEPSQLRPPRISADGGGGGRRGSCGAGDGAVPVGGADLEVLQRALGMMGSGAGAGPPAPSAVAAEALVAALRAAGPSSGGSAGVGALLLQALGPAVLGQLL